MIGYCLQKFVFLETTYGSLTHIYVHSQKHSSESRKKVFPLGTQTKLSVQLTVNYFRNYRRLEGF